MPIFRSPRVVLGAAVAAVAAAAALSCAASAPVVPSDGLLPLGTYGGDSGGMIVDATSMHLHIACTFGDVSGRVPVDASGRFDVAGSYTLRAYPVAIGPPVPARFTGSIDGDRIVVTATIDDTVEKRIVVRGPVSLRLGVEAKLGPCPICRTPGLRRSASPGVRSGPPGSRTPELTAATARARPTRT